MTVTAPRTHPAVQARLHRIEGQAHALVRMYEAGRPPADLLDLIAAIRAALGGLGLALISQQVSDPTGTEQSPPVQDDEHLETVLALVQRLVRCT